jgi:2-polyprenyl-6-methoxyphenol hydroxylase-like FAD-dependent oxidoreductase
MNFTIIGAGIGSLTTAHALLAQGHRVRVFERAESLRETGAGVVLGANAMQVLHYPSALLGLRGDKPTPGPA